MFHSLSFGPLNSLPWGVGDVFGENVWTDAASDNDGDSGNNWSLAHKPTTGEVAKWDDTSDDDCEFSSVLICGSVDATNGYDGEINLGENDATVVGAFSLVGSFTFVGLSGAVITCDTFYSDGMILQDSVYDVTGAIAPDITGVYSHEGNVNGKPYYKIAGFPFYVSWLNRWILGPGTPGVYNPLLPFWLNALGEEKIEGSYDPNSNAAGVATITGQAWFLDVGTSGEATDTTFQGCDARGGVFIDAADGTCTDEGNNFNVEFDFSSSSSSSSSSSTSSIVENIDYPFQSVISKRV